MLIISPLAPSGRSKKSGNTFQMMNVTSHAEKYMTKNNADGNHPQKPDKDWGQRKWFKFRQGSPSSRFINTGMFGHFSNN